MAQADSVPTAVRAQLTGATSKASTKRRSADRRYFIGGSDARIIMGDDEGALLRLWREKRGEIEPEDLSGNLLVQLGLATEDLNRRWYQVNAGQVLTDIQRRIKHPALRWMAATLDGRVEATGAVFEAKFMLPWAFSEESAAEKYMPQLQHNMWVVAARTAVLSVITGGGKWVEIVTHADPLYQHLIVTASSSRVAQNTTAAAQPTLDRSSYPNRTAMPAAEKIRACSILCGTPVTTRNGAGTTVITTMVIIKVQAKIRKT